MLKEGHIAEQARIKIFGKPNMDFKVDQKLVRKAKKNPLDFIEAEVARVQHEMDEDNI